MLAPDWFALAWRARAEPLEPCAALARGAAARALADRLLAIDDDGALARLAGVAGAGVLVVLGAADELPWTDGVEYLGIDRDAPALRLPTALHPGVPPLLLARALSTRTPGLIAVAPGLSCGLREARPIVRAQLRAWRDAT